MYRCISTVCYKNLSYLNCWSGFKPTVRIPGKVQVRCFKVTLAHLRAVQGCSVLLQISRTTFRTNAKLILSLPDAADRG